MDRAFEAPELIAAMDEAVNYNANIVDCLRRWSAPYTRILDFGAGNGRFTTALRDSGKTMSAMEPDPQLRDRIRASGATTYASLQQIPDASVDAVYSINVLEHIADDLGTLREIHRVMKPGGGLFLYVPAFQVLFSANDRRVGHLRRYRRRGLSKLVRRAGFTSVDSRYADALGFFAALAYRLVGNADGDLSISGVRAYDQYAFPVSLILDRLTSRVFGKNVLLEAIAAPNP